MNIDTKTLHQPTDFLLNLRESIDECVRQGNTVEAFLKDEYGIEDVMNYESDNFEDKNVEDFSVKNVRGNVQLMDSKFRTFKESQEILERVLSHDFSALLSYKP